MSDAGVYVLILLLGLDARHAIHVVGGSTHLAVGSVAPRCFCGRPELFDTSKLGSIDAGNALQRARRTAQGLATAERMLNARIVSLRAETDARLRLARLQGLPLAALGLMLIGLGTSTQWVGSTFL